MQLVPTHWQIEQSWAWSCVRAFSEPGDRDLFVVVLVEISSGLS